jgi:hypothetical protein
MNTCNDAQTIKITNTEETKAEKSDGSYCVLMF